jgi:hypothetical protein
MVTEVRPGRSGRVDQVYRFRLLGAASKGLEARSNLRSHRGGYRRHLGQRIAVRGETTASLRDDRGRDER